MCCASLLLPPPAHPLPSALLSRARARDCAQVWLPVVQRIAVPYEQYAPRVGLLAGGAGVAAFVLFIAGLWPAFGWLTPLVVTSQAMGVMMVAHFLPPCC